jgi:glycosyltransferase involved in cell wall biosynthesis
VPQRRLNIISNNIGFGLSRDIGLVRSVLEPCGWQVDTHGFQPPSIAERTRRTLRRIVDRRPAYDVNLFIELVIPRWFRHARANVLIPNQEWFQERAKRHLKRFDLVLCKTRHGEAIFQALGCRTSFVSFTSVDRRTAVPMRERRSLFHLAGRSRQKGTAAIVALWGEHPEWPTLTIVQHPERATVTDLPNVRWIVNYIADDDLIDLQNRHGIHLQPSEVEGFGHCIGEGMSCGAVVVTTDAPPMNELVTPERGLLAAWRDSEPMRLGTAYRVDPADLARRIIEALGLDDAAHDRLGAAARAWYEDNDRFFRRRLPEVLNDI